MKVRITIDVDMDTGGYELKLSTKKKGGKIDQQYLVTVIQKILDNWKLKFVN